MITVISTPYDTPLIVWHALFIEYSVGLNALAKSKYIQWALLQYYKHINSSHYWSQ